MSFANFVPALFYTSPDGERVVPLERESMALGRSSDNDIVLPEAFVSRHHALLLREGSSYLAVDLNSTHGTYLNGTRLVDRAVLKVDDVLQLGSPKAPKLQFKLHQTAGFANDNTPRMHDLLSSFSGFLPGQGDDAQAMRRPGTREIEQLNFLLSAARALNSGGAIEDILRTLLQLTLQLTGVDRGFVFLQQGATDEQPGELRLAQGLLSSGQAVYEDATVSRGAIQRAIQSDSKFSVTDTLADEDASRWSSIMVNNIRSIYCIPLRKRLGAHQPGDLLGLLYLDSQIRTGELCGIDHELLDTIAAEAAGLLHNALLAREEQEARQAREELAVAARIHTGLMSIKLPTLPWAVLDAKMIPCLAIGGDFFDAIALDDHVCVTVADVSGKGVSAAIVAATLQGIIHAQLMARQSLSSIAHLINQFLCSRNVGKYATMIMLKVFADGRVEYMNCGHVQPVAVLGDRVRRLEAGDLVVGLIASATYTSATCTLSPGERILLATDGITEAEDPAGAPLGDEGLKSIASLNTLDEMLAHVARYHAPNDAQDDCTLVEVRYTGAS